MTEAEPSMRSPVIYTVVALLELAVIVFTTAEEPGRTPRLIGVTI